MENYNLTNIQKELLRQLNYFNEAHNSLNSYSRKLEVKNRELEKENNFLKIYNNSMSNTVEETTQFIDKFAIKNVKSRNIFEDTEIPERVSTT